MKYSLGNRPRVSVIMPVLNGERYIKESIESILAQTYQDFELIVVDDGSTDRTPELIQAFSSRMNLKYVPHTERQGIARSINDGVRHSSGELIAFLDHDDIWYPNFLDTQVGYLDQHPEVAMVHCDFQTMDADGNVLDPSIAALRDPDARPSGRVFPQLFMDSFILGISVVIREECFHRAGGFDESVRFGDYLLWMRIAWHYRIDYLPQVLTQYRLHPVQSTQAALVTDPDKASGGVQAINKILELYPQVRDELGAPMISRRLARLYSDVADRWFSVGEFPTARLCLRKAIRHWPTKLRYYMVYIATFVPTPVLTYAREAWRRIGGSGPAKSRTAEQPHPVADGRPS